ncbi:DUF5906 domain-containing protein [Pollutibacter soli]|uniref:DUF5906 domain-containing protein n=1 Tax=Pollutibacter soli TaxID=3034157 RepID=UPI003013CF87
MITQEIQNLETLSSSVVQEYRGIIFFERLVDRNGNVKDVKVIYTKLYEFLMSLGFFRFDIGREFIMVKRNNNIIEPVSIHEIQDVFFDHIKEFPDELPGGLSKEMLIEKFNKSPDTYFSTKRFSLLRSDTQFEFLEDSMTSAYFFYRNGYVECTPSGWYLKSYDQLEKVIWKSQILDRIFLHQQIEEIPKFKNLGIFAQFIYNVCAGKDKRIASLCTAMGYMLHSYMNMKLKAIILTDGKISESPDGRTGKSLVLQALSQMKKTTILKGKEFDDRDKFKYDELDIDTKLLALDDVKPRFNIETMFNVITEGVRVNKKNKQPLSVRPKIAITTNRTISIEGASAKDRAFEFEFADHYSDKFSPYDEFGKWFFKDDFTDQDWCQFDNFMLYCVSVYLEKGLIAAESISLDRRKLIEATSSDFIEFMEGLFESGNLKTGEKCLKKDLHILFLRDYPEYTGKSHLGQMAGFTKALKLFARYTPGFAEVTKDDEIKSGANRYIIFRAKI